MATKSLEAYSCEQISDDKKTTRLSMKLALLEAVRLSPQVLSFFLELRDNCKFLRRKKCVCVQVQVPSDY